MPGRPSCATPDPSASRHRDAYAQTLARLEREGVPGLHPAKQTCIPPLVHALTSKRPRHRYPVTFPTKLFTVLRRLPPSRWLDKLLIKSV